MKCLAERGHEGAGAAGGFAFEAKGLPRLRQNLYFAGYSEGWALYAEQLADELGM